MDPEQAKIQIAQAKASMKNEFKLIKQGSKTIFSVGIILEIIWFIGWILGYINFFIFLVPLVLFIAVGYCGLKSKQDSWGSYLNPSLFFLMFITGFLFIISGLLFVISIVDICKECDYSNCKSNQTEGSIIFMVSIVLMIFFSPITTLCWFMSSAFERYTMSSIYIKVVANRY